MHDTYNGDCFIDCCPCNHKCWNNDKKNRGCTKYVTIPDDYRLSIDRCSIAFKSVYALRTEAERYNSRFKQAGFERVFVRSGNSVKNLNTIAHISLLSIAIAAVITKKAIANKPNGEDQKYLVLKNCQASRFKVFTLR